MVLEKIIESPLDYKESKGLLALIDLVSPKGNQPWIFTGRTDVKAETLILGPPDTKSRKDLMLRK